MSKNNGIATLIQEKIFNFVSFYNAVLEFCLNIIRSHTFIFTFIGMIVTSVTGIIPIILFVGILLVPYILFYRIEAEKEKNKIKKEKELFGDLYNDIMDKQNPEHDRYKTLLEIYEILPTHHQQRLDDFMKTNPFVCFSRGPKIMRRLREIAEDYK